MVIVSCSPRAAGTVGTFPSHFVTVFATCCCVTPSGTAIGIELPFSCDGPAKLFAFCLVMTAASFESVLLLVDRPICIDRDRCKGVGAAGMLMYRRGCGVLIHRQRFPPHHLGWFLFNAHGNSEEDRAYEQHLVDLE